MSEKAKFLPGYVAGDYLASEIDDFIARWHEIGPRMSLREFLGFEEDEWEIWIVDDSSLGQIAIARENNVPIRTQLMRAREYALAARSDKPVEAQQIIDRLENGGHV
jgi:hypothetical protein